ncbi:MAG: hypothetical protein ACLPWF_11135 [Bryobacteraceae bacterium]|jgi:hypothetical protein
MIYVKSFLIGVAALIVVALVIGAFFLAAPIIGLMSHQAEGGVGIYVLGPFIPAWAILTSAAVIFATAFYWSFKRSKARQ